MRFVDFLDHLRDQISYQLVFCGIPVNSGVARIQPLWLVMYRKHSSVGRP